MQVVVKVVVVVKEAMDEFATKWLEEEIRRLLGNTSDDTMVQTLLELEGTCQNLRMLLENLADLVGHFVSFE